MSRHEETFLNWCLLKWVCSVLAVAMLASMFNIHVGGTSLFNAVDAVIPSIGRWSALSSRPGVFSTIWLYMVISAPLVIGYLIFKLQRHTAKKVWGALILAAPFLYIFGSLFLAGGLFGTSASEAASSPRIQFFSESFFGGVFFSLLFGVGFIFFTAECVLLLLEVTGINAIRRKVPDELRKPPEGSL